MTPQESTMLNDLVNKIRQTQLPEKDEEAEQFLKQSLATSPDAQYILAQTVLVQNIALEQARAQIDQLQEHLQEARTQLQQPPPAPAQHTSFLGSLLGRHDQPAAPPPQAFSPQPYPPRAAASPQYYPPAPAYPPDYAAAPPPPSGGSSFLRSAATTAAGVAAGALAFEGVESLLHGFGHGGGGFGGGGFGGGGLGDRPVEETVVNNYYEDPNQNFGGEERGGREASFDDRGDRFANDDRGAQFNDASYDPGDSQNLGSLDDQSGGDFDDGGNFDDSGDDSNVV